jgi:hypothetical protein
MGEMADPTPRPKGKVVASTTSDVLRAVSTFHPAYSRLLRDTITSSDGTGELCYRFTQSGRENASVRDRGRRRRSKQRLFCNGKDRLKVRQGTPVDTDKAVNAWEKLDARRCLSKRNHVRRKTNHLSTLRLASTGKPDEAKVSRPVWSGGKVVRPDLSLRGIDQPDF